MYIKVYGKARLVYITYIQYISVKSCHPAYAGFLLALTLVPLSV